MRSAIAGILEISRHLQAATACSECGKFSCVANALLASGARGFRAEVISPETHCACAPSTDRPNGGPAWAADSHVDDVQQPAMVPEPHSMEAPK